jgi:hypothetical protein
MISMMKPYIAVLFLILPLFLNGQSIDFEKVKYAYTRPPQTPFPKGSRTYSVVVNPGNVDFTGKGHNYNIGYTLEQAIVQRLLVNGYQRILPGSSEKADVIMEYSFSGPIQEKKTVNSKTTTVNGKSATAFHIDLSYYFPVTLKIKDKAGTLIQTIAVVPSHEQFSFRYPEKAANDFKDRQQAESSFNNSYFPRFINNHLRDKGLASATSYINHHFAFTDITEWIYLPYIGPEKSAYPRLDSCHLKLSKAIQIINNKGSMDQVSLLANAVLADALALSSEYKPGNKKEQHVAKKISGACDYNSAIAYMLLDQYDPALASLKASHEKMGHGHLASLKALIEDKKKRFLANQ